MAEKSLREKELEIKTALALGDYRSQVACGMGNLWCDMHHEADILIDRLNGRDYAAVHTCVVQLVKMDGEMTPLLGSLESDEQEKIALFKHDLLEAVGWLNRSHADQLWGMIVKGWRRSHFIEDEFVTWFFQSAAVINAYSASPV